MIRVSSDGRLVGSEAIASPAGSGGAGGLLSERGPEHARTVNPRESGGISNPAVGVSTA